MKTDEKMLLEMIEQEIQNHENNKRAPRVVPDDHEGSMAKSELRDMIKNGLILYKLINKNDELPGWVSSYITLASDYMHSVTEYMIEDQQSDELENEEPEEEIDSDTET